MPDGRLCLVCGDYGSIALGIRARYENTNAVWAPNLDAYLCEDCALSGCVIELTYRQTSDGRVRVRTNGPQRYADTVLRIGSGFKEIPGQTSLSA